MGEITLDTHAYIESLMYGTNIEKRRAARHLGEIGDRGAVEPLIQALKDEDYMVRSYAAEALGRIKDRQAVEPLIQALRDKYGIVRGSAASALGEIGDGRAVEPLIDVLYYDEGARDYAASALGDIGGERAVEALTWAVNYDWDKGCLSEDIREVAEKALTRIKEKK